MKAIIADNDYVYLDTVTPTVEVEIVKLLSAKAKGAQYIDTTQATWDGWYRKYYKTEQKFARPLLSDVAALCKRLNIKLDIQDARGPAVPLDASKINKTMLPGITLEDYQVRTLEAICGNEVGIIKSPTGSGKCLGRGTPVMMYDGSIKNVEDIKVGDVLMGDDSGPRNVLSCCTGMEQLFKIKQKSGDDYIVNKSHVLSLSLTPERIGDKHKYFDMPLADYLVSNKTFKHRAKGYKVGVSFPSKEVPIDPYLLGLWLGDGIAADTRICVNRDDVEIIDYLNQYCVDNKYVLVKYAQKSYMDEYAIRLYESIHNPIDGFDQRTEKNKLKQALISLNLIRNKHVPDLYKQNSEEVRLALLAGFIDADGHAEFDRDTAVIVHRDNILAAGIVYIARTLGFKTTYRVRKKRCTTTGFEGDYAAITLSGNLDRIPTKLARKKFQPRKINKNHMVCGIKVEPVGVGEYFGFEIDGNRRFLLGDCTVTHNTELMAAIAGVYGKTTVIIADIRVVIEQIKERLELRDVAGDDGIGLFYGGATPSGQKIIVGSIQSLTTPPVSLNRISPKIYKARMKRARLFQEIVKRAGLLMVDECDKAVSKPYKQLFKFHFKGRYKFGFSATPFDPDKPVENLVLREHLGPIISEIGRDEVQETGRIIPIKFYMMAEGEDGDKNDARTFDIAEREIIVDNDKFHSRVAKIVSAFPDDGTLILIDTTNVEDLGFKLEQKIPGSKFIYGKTSKSQRNKAIEQFEKRELKCLIGGKILKRGLDLRGGAENLIIIGGGKLYSNFDQKIGRAVRCNARGKARVFSFYFVNNKYLYLHSRKQLKALVGMGYYSEVVFSDARISGEDLIKARFRRPKPKKQ